MLSVTLFRFTKALLVKRGKWHFLARKIKLILCIRLPRSVSGNERRSRNVKNGVSQAKKYAAKTTVSVHLLSAWFYLPHSTGHTEWCHVRGGEIEIYANSSYHNLHFLLLTRLTTPSNVCSRKNNTLRRCNSLKTPLILEVLFSLLTIRLSREIRVAFDYIPPQETKELRVLS